MEMDKKLVIPGDFLSDDAKQADEGTYVENGKVFSSVFGIASLKDHIRVVPLSGKYIPRAGDMVIGVIKEIAFSNWIVDIRSPYEGLLHISEFPRRIESSDMPKYLNIGDSIMTLVRDVDANMKVELTLNDQRLRPVKEGRVIEVTPSKVPRLIGRGGSMIAMLKNETGCNIFIGQNGRVWITGKDKGMDLAARAILKIERETHISGLTDRITKFLKEEKGGKPKEKEPEKEEQEKKEPEPAEQEEKMEDEKESLPAEEEKTAENKPGGILDELLGNDK
ncbi:Exosome complex component Rrp4 [Candidatus Methanoperedens nitroreducens]|uniref:Exosome complex component Rrp4 n=2 Tax=Candidatus Methanoperedens nitratireducens TaxID=1392998 RepID=A0A284VJP6_9EURY|nr:Exosome complex component Rrp4 [Candidatus Methanoperedens nitroreducens]